MAPAKAAMPTSASVCPEPVSSRLRRCSSTANGASRSRASASARNSRRSSKTTSSDALAERFEAVSAPRIAAVRGMNDLLPAQAQLWETFEACAVRVLQGYGYAQIRTPVVEPTALFRRGLGEVTDIVEREMYSFVDSLNGEALTLRPENTAGVVRAVIEHSLLYDRPRRLWYMGPMFRHERPARGRYRQFHQAGAEAL